jgi:hypothetical protein
VCPDTPFCADPVDADGCPADSDGDGVVDGCDACPETPECAEVAEDGCPIDSDQDGVADGCDECPGTGSGGLVGPNGCTLGDSNADESVDSTDFCCFLRCYSGPDVPYPEDPAGECPEACPEPCPECLMGCYVFDYDYDGDVDLHDYSAFLDCYAGSGTSPCSPPAD